MRATAAWKKVAGCGIGLALLLALLVDAAPAQAHRALLSDHAVYTLFCLRCPPPSQPPPPLIPPPEGQIEGPCGIAIGPSPNRDIYVSDYYHRLIDVYSNSGGYISQIKNVATAPEGPCGLAFGPGGTLYANIWHQSVVRLTPSFQLFDSASSTGVAVDDAGRVYANDRTYVAVYDSSGAPILEGGQPLRIGLGSLGDAYGLAVFDDRVYVADAADGTVKVYEPSTDPLDPVLTIDGPGPPQGGFNSLVDAGLAVDPTNGHLLVLDNLQPGYEHPQAAIYEFDSSGAYLGVLPGSPVHGEPSGLAVDPVSGTLYVTDGNSELANVFAFGPYTASPPSSTQPPGEAPSLAPLLSQSGDKAQEQLLSPVPGALSPQRSRPRRPRHRQHRPRRHARLWSAKVVSRR